MRHPERLTLETGEEELEAGSSEAWTAFWAVVALHLLVALVLALLRWAR